MTVNEKDIIAEEEQRKLEREELRERKRIKDKINKDRNQFAPSKFRRGTYRGTK